MISLLVEEHIGGRRIRAFSSTSDVATVDPEFSPLSLPEYVGSQVRPGCEVCMGAGWVCEDHPLKPWESGYAVDCRCGAPGMPCVCTGLQGDLA